LVIRLILFSHWRWKTNNKKEKTLENCRQRGKGQGNSAEHFEI